MVSDFISRILACQTISQLAHWQTDSYAQHEALGQFYSELPSLTDKFVEAYIGAFGKEDVFEYKIDDVVKHLEDELMWLNKHKEKITKDSPGLSNIFDEITTLHMRALYKLKNLR